MKIVSEEYDRLVKEGSIPVDERIVDKFTPYTPEEREQNFIPFTSKDTRNAFERNPSYERALKAAQERKRQKELEKQNGVKAESKQKIHVTKDDITEAINQVLKEYDDGGSNGDYAEEQSVYRMGKHLYDAEHSIKMALEETYDSKQNYRQTGEYMYEGGKDELYDIYKTLVEYIKKWEESNSFYLD